MSRLVLRDLHRFDAGGHPFVYLVPSAAIFRLDEPSAAVPRACCRCSRSAMTAAAVRSLTARDDVAWDGGAGTRSEN